MKVITENSKDVFEVIDLSEFAEVKIFKKNHSWAQGGYYREVEVRHPGSSKYSALRIDLESIENYEVCMELNIAPEDYNIYLRVKKLLE